MFSGGAVLKVWSTLEWTHTHTYAYMLNATHAPLSATSKNSYPHGKNLRDSYGSNLLFNAGKES